MKGAFVSAGERDIYTVSCCCCCLAGMGACAVCAEGLCRNACITPGALLCSLFALGGCRVAALLNPQGYNVDTIFLV